MVPFCVKSHLSDKTAGSRKAEWFIEWFNSPYYHLLYKDRNEAEAKKFIDRLLEVLKLPPQANVLDLACGRGRYSRYLAEKGYFVTGLDIATTSIAFARQFENERLSFFVHDMRHPYRTDYFDCIFNFFTSLGYFESEKDHLKTVTNIAKDLKPQGKFALDFFNSKKVIRTLRSEETKTIEHVTFHIRRSVNEQGYILKNIGFYAEGRHFEFTERVRAFTLEDFNCLFEKAGLTIAQTFGDYYLSAFDEENSERLILIGCKTGC